MGTTSEILHFENARLAQQLYNNDPRNLLAIEEFATAHLSRLSWP